jgi:hypothetical protein
MLMPEPLMQSSAVSAPSLATSEWLTLAVVRAAREAHAATSELREAVCAHVRELKARGYPPERMLVVVKALLAEAGIRKTGPLADRGSATLGPETQICECVVAWSIEEYFAAAAGSHGGSRPSGV